MVRFDAVVFDLDGTLLHTAPEIAAGVNGALRDFDLPPATLSQVLGWIGQGTQRLMQRALAAQTPAGCEMPALDVVYPHFERHYHAINGRLAQPYPGVRDTLDALAARGVPMALLTNKEAEFTEPLLAALQLTGYFRVRVFGDTLAERKPSALPLVHTLRELGVAPGRALMVGDSEADVATARAAGVAVWVVRDGYRHVPTAEALGADRVIDSLVPLLDQVAPPA